MHQSMALDQILTQFYREGETLPNLVSFFYRSRLRVLSFRNEATYI